MLYGHINVDKLAQNIKQTQLVNQGNQLLMTKEDRLQKIESLNAYAQNIHSLVAKHVPADEVFSQQNRIKEIRSKYRNNSHLSLNSDYYNNKSTALARTEGVSPHYKSSLSDYPKAECKLIQLIHKASKSKLDVSKVRSSGG
jgi:hypothetical protein